MSVHRTTNCRFAYQDTGDANWDTVTVVPLIQQLDTMEALKGLYVCPSSGGGLLVRMSAGFFLDSTGAEIDVVAIDPISCPDNTTNYLWLDETGTFTLGSAWPASNYVIRLAKVVCVSGAITVLTNYRPAWQIAGRGTATQTIVSTSYTVTDADGTLFIDPVTAGGNVAIALMTPVGRAGHEVDFLRTTAGGNTITITPAAGLINGAGTLALPTQYGLFTLKSDGTNWYIYRQI